MEWLKIIYVSAHQQLFNIHSVKEKVMWLCWCFRRHFHSIFSTQMNGFRFTWTLCSAPSTTCCRLAALRDCSSRAHYYLDICSNDISSELSLPPQQLYVSSPSFSACLQMIPLGTHLELHVPHNHRPLHNSQCTRRFRYKLSFAIGVHGVAPLTLTQKSTKFQCTSQSGQLYAMKYCQ